MTEGSPKRRANFEASNGAVTYGSVGGTQAEDLLRYPPEGFTSGEVRAKLGSGAARFQQAVDGALTWQIQRGAGVEVVDVVADEPGTEYRPILFDDEGRPIAPEHDGHRESLYAEDGTPYIAAGMTAVLKLDGPGSNVEAPVRVVYTVDEPNRKGFAYGTLPGHPECGEESFIVTHEADDGVYLTIRWFTKPEHWLRKAAKPLAGGAQRKRIEKYLRSLHPAATITG